MFGKPGSAMNLRVALGISLGAEAQTVKIREIPTSPDKQRREIWGTRLGGRGRLLSRVANSAFATLT
jgi:hypothetical protein